jgi:cytochrome c oxidase cbb3-type subunit I/II
MPGYPWMYESKLDLSHTEGKILTMQKLGVPYPDGFATQAADNAREQANNIAAQLHKTGIKDVDPDKEIIAVIAYLQRLGTDVKKPATHDHEQHAGAK